MTEPPLASPVAAIKQEPLQGKLEPSFGRTVVVTQTAF